MNRMKHLFKSESGFSAVEMLVAVTIVGMIMGAIGSFLSSSIRSFETTVDVIDIQFEGQLAFNAIGKTAMESTGIDYIHDGALEKTGTNEVVVDPQFLGFNNSDGTITIFYFNDAEDKLMFKTTTDLDSEYNLTDMDSWYDFAYNIDTWTVKPGVGNLAYDDGRSIHIQMTLEDDGAAMNISNFYEFRNKVN